MVDFDRSEFWVRYGLSVAYQKLVGISILHGVERDKLRDMERSIIDMIRVLIERSSPGSKNAADAFSDEISDYFCTIHELHSPTEETLAALEAIGTDDDAASCEINIVNSQQGGRIFKVTL